MASGSLVGGGGDGSQEKHRWSESKVYTRKVHNKNPKTTINNTGNANNGSNPISSQQTLATAEDLNSSLQQPPPPPLPIASSAPSDDDASSLNRGNHRFHPRTVTISLTPGSRHELRELRRRLSTELEQVRALSRKVEAHELRLSAASVPAHTLSQFSASEPCTPAPTRRPPPPSNTEAASLRRPLSVSVPPGENSATDTFEKEKRTPKANQYYRNSDFILGKEKIPLPDSHNHKKAKANGSRKGDADYGLQTVDRKLYAQAFKSCSALLSKLMKHPHGWVFNTPVDVKRLGLHDYYTIIKHPMDLGTIKSRLAKNWYKLPREFAEEVRLTFRNAMTYNPKGQDVHIMAEELSQLFEEQWPAIEAEYAYLLHHPPPAKKAPRPPPLDLRTLERSDSTAHPMAESKTKPVNHTPQFGRSPALKKPKAKDLHKRDMTFEEKQKLSNNLQNLPPEKLDNIVQIIKKRNLAMNQHDDEIEVDIDSADVETLWELDRFVTNYKKSLSKNKRKAELASLRRAEANHSGRERIQETVGSLPEPVAAEANKESKTAVDGKDALAVVQVHPLVILIVIVPLDMDLMEHIHLGHDAHIMQDICKMFLIWITDNFLQ
ncbi:hypothetical protein J5N97_007713 [Dioscorea zingiberensis]|uniref:Transcription factor GTE4 n=1 Tax=Dioscorea zingiberensis TaxID=325984 RepID=A0A9D5HVU9_9LILI|nr:hypothetical protein J5N97_007713 [Dioscorea zingiberensis]